MQSLCNFAHLPTTCHCLDGREWVPLSLYVLEHISLPSLLSDAADSAGQDERLGDMHELCCLCKGWRLWHTLCSRCGCSHCQNQPMHSRWPQHLERVQSNTMEADRHLQGQAAEHGPCLSVSNPNPTARHCLAAKCHYCSICCAYTCQNSTIPG